MKPIQAHSKLKTSSLLLLLLLIAGAPVKAQYFWDPTGHKAAPGSGGNGAWDLKSTNWWLAGNLDSVWTNGNGANFAGTTGTVTLATNVSAAGLNFTTSGYIINGTNPILSLIGATPTISVPLAGTAYLGCILGGSNGLAVTGGGTLSLAATNVYTNGTFIDVGTRLAIVVAGQLGAGKYAGGITNFGTLAFSSSATQNLSGIISGPGDLIQGGTSALSLGASNTYSGDTVVTKGTLTLTTNGSINFTDLLQIGAGGAFNVTSQSYFLLNPNAALAATGNGTNAAAAILRAGTLFNAGSQPIALNYAPSQLSGSATNQSLFVATGALQLNGNTITVTNAAAAPLGAGLYTLISQASGSLSNTAPLTLTVAGQGVAAGNAASLEVTGGALNLRVRPISVFSSLSASRTANYGSGIILTGQVHTANSLYPTLGETVTATIGGITATGSVTNATGRFVIFLTPTNTPASPTPYPITYGFGGDTKVSPASDQSTTLTIQPAPLTVAINNQVTDYGTPIPLVNNVLFTPTGLQYADAIDSVSVTVNSPFAGSGQELPGHYPLAPSAAVGQAFNAANYAITYLPGTLQVLPPQRSLTTLYNFQWKNFAAASPYGPLLLVGNRLLGACVYANQSDAGGLFSMNVDGTDFEILHAFTNGRDGGEPGGALTLSGSTLYGVTGYGPGPGRGTVFAMDLDGSNLRTLHVFNPAYGNQQSSSEGGAPAAGLTIVGERIYGCTLAGGNAGLGTLFALNGDGSQYRVLHQFVGAPDGAQPNGELLLVGNLLLGTTQSGGISNLGAIFSVHLDGTGFTSLGQFNGANGAYPDGALLMVSGRLFGVTSSGGNFNSGTIFSLGLDGSGFTNLYHFTGQADGGNPVSKLAATGGMLYGVTSSGGRSGGTVFAINPDGSQFQVLRNFDTAYEGNYPRSPLIAAGSRLYGATFQNASTGNGALFALNTDGTGMTNLHNFNYQLQPNFDAPTNYFVENFAGAYPAAGLTLAGNTLFGSASGGGNFSQGTIFSIAIDGSAFAPLHIFTGAKDGGVPLAPPILAGNSLFGSASNDGDGGYGLLYAMNPDGSNFTVLRNFTNSPDGALPIGPLVLDGTTLYGLTAMGGSNGVGLVFSVQTNGSAFTVLHHFVAARDGANPAGGLLLAGGRLYGATAAGGTTGNGTVFALNSNGQAFTNLHNFSALEGTSPNGGLWLIGSTLYGAAARGGLQGFGSLFSLNTNGTAFTNFYSFTGLSDGGQPRGGLTLCGGLLYGTTWSAGGWNYGNVFQITTNGADLAEVYAFEGFQDGANPAAGLVSSGSLLFGTTYYSGIQYGSPTNDFGTLFAINSVIPPLITWNNPGDIIYGTSLSASQLNATANIPGSFSFSPPAGALLPASPNQWLTANFIPADTGTYVPARQSVEINVNPLPVVLAGSRAFDGGNLAAYNILSILNAVGADQVLLSAGSALLTGGNPGTNALNNLGTLALAGSAATNYTLVGASGSVIITGGNTPFSISSASLDATGTNLVLCWQSQSGNAYHILTSTNLARPAWQDLGAPYSPVTASGPTTCVTLPIRRFPTNTFFMIRQP